MSKAEYVDFASTCPRRGPYKKELSLGAKIGIGVGVAAATVATLLVCVAVLWRHRARMQKVNKGGVPDDLGAKVGKV
jgi:hypothetical protein